MATTITMESTSPAAARVGLTRALAVAASTFAAVAVWTLAVPILGIHLLIRFGTGAPQSIGISSVVGAGLTASLLAWGLLVVLERRAARPRTIWTGVAVGVLVVSLSLPLIIATTMSGRIALAAMHLAVAAVLIPALRHSSPARLDSAMTGRRSV